MGTILSAGDICRANMSSGCLTLDRITDANQNRWHCEHMWQDDINLTVSEEVRVRVLW